MIKIIVHRFLFAYKFQATLAYPQSCVLCGDNDSRAVDRTKSNMDASTIGCKIDLVQWTASKLPFKDSFVDIIVTDMVRIEKLISKNFIPSL